MSKTPRMTPSRMQQSRFEPAIVDNPIVPLATGAVETRAGVFQRGAVVLAGDVLLEALNGDSMARAELKVRQEKRKQQRQRQLQQIQQPPPPLWTPRSGTRGQKAKVLKPLVLRKGVAMDTDKIGNVPEGVVVHVLDMRPGEDGMRRALVQNEWGKKGGWVTALSSDGESALEAIRDEHEPMREESRSNWLGKQKENWNRHHYPHADHIPHQQEDSQPVAMQMQQQRRRERATKSENAAGRRTTAPAPNNGARSQVAAAAWLAQAKTRATKNRS